MNWKTAAMIAVFLAFAVFFTWFFYQVGRCDDACDALGGEYEGGDHKIDPIAEECTCYPVPERKVIKLK